jgi:hypothetical protein
VFYRAPDIEAISLLTVIKSTRELYGFELEPEVRDWLDSLSDSDYMRVDEVCGLLAEKGTEPTIPLLRRLAAALNADVRLTGGHDLGSVWFETHAA